MTATGVIREQLTALGSPKVLGRSRSLGAVPAATDSAAVRLGARTGSWRTALERCGDRADSQRCFGISVVRRYGQDDGENRSVVVPTVEESVMSHWVYQTPRAEVRIVTGTIPKEVHHGLSATCATSGAPC